MPPKGSRSGAEKLVAFEAWAVEHASVLAQRARTRPAQTSEQMSCAMSETARDSIAQLLNVLRKHQSKAERRHYRLLKELQSGRWRAMVAVPAMDVIQRIWHSVSLCPALPSSDGSASGNDAVLPLLAESPPRSKRTALVVDVGVLLGLAGRLRVLIDDRRMWG